MTKTLTKLAVVGAMSIAAQATTIDFGTSWPAGPITGGDYLSAPYNRVIGTSTAAANNDAQIATMIDSFAGTSFALSNSGGGNPLIHDGALGSEINPPDGYFTVGGGWDYLLVKYGTPGGGFNIVIKLDGNDAKVPYDSSLLSGSGDKYAVSHWATAGEHREVPDGGATIALLGFGLLGLGAMRRKVS